MKIGITDTHNEDIFDNYKQWLHNLDSTLEIVRLSYASANAAEIHRIDGLLLSGGGDVDPQAYHKHDDLPKTKGVDAKRDAFEYELIDHALDADMPILGICRGMQVMNVYLHGSLITDLVSSRFDDHTGEEDQEREHMISIVPNTLLSALAGTNEVRVNTFHHQSIDRIGRGLMTSSVSDDGIVESVEWALKDAMPFLMLVQWHPERSQKSFLSEKIARMFLREATNYRNNKE
jgi:putative glutamine amidotransferase